MKCIKIIVAIVISAYCVSCDDIIQNVDCESGAYNSTSETDELYEISEDEAVARFAQFVQGESRSDAYIETDSIMCIYAQKESESSCSKLLYVANIRDGGYAVLAADNRIDSDILAYVEEGYISEESLNPSKLIRLNPDRPLYSGYPTSGPGLIRLPEYGNQLFMNPNTINLRILDKGDTLVGNFDDGSEPMQNKIQRMTIDLCRDYALNRIRRSVEENGDKNEHFKYNDGERNGGGSSDTYRYVTETGSWDLKLQKGPFLTRYRNWGQSTISKNGDPYFNKLFPKRRKYILFGEIGNAPSGCFPLAIAKVMTYHRVPNTFTYNGFTINWGVMNEPVGNMVQNQNLNYLLRGVADMCNSWYFYEGTFTFPSEGIKGMQNAAFLSAKLNDYSFEYVQKMIDANKPTIVLGMPNINLSKSHVWNIDGYRLYSRIITTYKYLNDKLISTSQREEDQNMVHCDFGWRGIANGYYISGVFDSSKSENKLDINYTGESFNYNVYLKIITY